MPQIPVAVFITAFEPGGTERQMTELIRRLDPQRFRVHVACFRREGAWLPKVAERAASLVEFRIKGLARPGTLLQMLRFARWCRRERIAVVQTCDWYANTFALPAAWLARVPVRIGSRRDLNPDKSAAQIRLQRHAYRWATRIVANCAAAFQVLEAEGVPQTQATVIPNGIDTAAYPERTPREGVTTIITVANLRAEKSHETLIAAASELAPASPHLRYRIVGDGPRRAELERFAAARGVGSIVEFLGHQEDVASLLREADAFVLPSRSEAFPNGAIEAMAVGLPVIASAVGGLLDLITPGRTGILVDPGDSSALASAIKSLVDDPTRARALGAEARREVMATYSFERMVAAFEDLYQSELDRKRQRFPKAAVRGRARVEGSI